MRIVSESIKHLTPLNDKELYNGMLQDIHYKEIAHLVSNENPDTLWCLYCWNGSSDTTSKYFTNVKLALKQYLNDASDTIKEIEKDYNTHKIFTMYTIDSTQDGTFSDDGMIATGGVKIIFDIEFHNHKVFFSAE